MARIDFNTKNIGKQIHDDGDYEIPERIISDPALGLPERFGLNPSESPAIVFDRFPGLTDTQVAAELDREWNEQTWPENCSEFLSALNGVKQEAKDRLDGCQWRLDRALELNNGDYTHADVVAEITKRNDIRAKSGEREELIKAAFLARKDPQEWPDQKNWTSEYMTYSSANQDWIQEGNASYATPLNVGPSTVKEKFDIDNPGRKD